MNSYEELRLNALQLAIRLHESSSLRNDPRQVAETAEIFARFLGVKSADESTIGVRVSQ